MPHGHHHHDEGHHGHHHDHHGHHHGSYEGHHHGRERHESDHGHHHEHEGHGERQVRSVRVKEGDVLACTCKDCNVELTVTKACEGEVCGTGCEVDVRCCGEPMQLRVS
jgi:hypothetical protein